jgi:DNA-binding NarL/FixJ family response regulator
VSQLRIVIADDHEIVRQGFRRLLGQRPDWIVCGEAASGREVVELARQLKPDMVVMDLGLPELNGLEATRQIRKELPRTRVLLLTVGHSEQLIREVLAAGADGCVLKTDAATVLLTAVESLSRRQPFFTSPVAQPMVRGFLASPPGTEHPPATLSELTAREREVLKLVAGGRSNKETAQALGVSVKTVETHRANLMRKLCFHSVSELVRYAIRLEVIEP